MNFIDIDCGPLGNCSTEIAKARKNFTGLFQAGWNRVNDNLEKSNKTDTEITMSLKKLCPDDLMNQLTTDNIKALLCLSTYFLFKMGLENKEKAINISNNITNELIKTNFFKKMHLNDFKNKITLKIENETNITELGHQNIKINWTCNVNCQSILNLSYKFFYKISALTSRVTKLGTLLVWSDSYNQAREFLKSVYNKISNQTTNVELDNLVLALSAGVGFDFFKIILSINFKKKILSS